MHPDMKQVINLITQRIENLQQIKAMLLEEFGVSSERGVTVIAKPAQRINSNNKSKNGHAVPSRKDELVKFLSEKGPSKRSKINAESGIPVGTVANLLNGNDFVRRSDGTWDVRDVREPHAEKSVQ